MIFRKNTLPVASIAGLGQAVPVCPNLWIEFRTPPLHLQQQRDNSLTYL
ncbi:MAG: hypothetical protein ACFFD2_25310 [Promethearchaeota archaeon]